MTPHVFACHIYINLTGKQWPKHKAGNKPYKRHMHWPIVRSDTRQELTWNRILHMNIWHFVSSDSLQPSKNNLFIAVGEMFPIRIRRKAFLIPFVFTNYRIYGMPVTSVMLVWFHYRVPKIRLMSAKTNFTSGVFGGKMAYVAWATNFQKDGGD